MVKLEIIKVGIGMCFFKIQKNNKNHKSSGHLGYSPVSNKARHNVASIDQRELKMLPSRGSIRHSL